MKLHVSDFVRSLLKIFQTAFKYEKLSIETRDMLFSIWLTAREFVIYFCRSYISGALNYKELDKKRRISRAEEETAIILK